MDIGMIYHIKRLLPQCWCRCAVDNPKYGTVDCWVGYGSAGTVFGNEYVFTPLRCIAGTDAIHSTGVNAVQA